MGFQGTLFWNKSIWQLQVVKYHNCGENYASIEWACSNLFNQPRDVPSKPADPLIVALSFQLVKSIQVIAGIRLKRNSFFQDAIYAVSMLISRFPFFFYRFLRVAILKSDLKNLSHPSEICLVQLGQLLNLQGRIHLSGPRSPQKDALQISFHLWIMLDYIGLYCIQLRSSNYICNYNSQSQFGNGKRVDGYFSITWLSQWKVMLQTVA